MEQVSISKFKAQCLRILDEVNRTREPLAVTRNGQPLVVVHPVPEKPQRVAFGVAKASGKVLDDIVAPAIEAEDWEALQ